MRETIAIDGLEAALTAGDNRLTINLTGDNKMPYVLNVSYRTLSRRAARRAPCGWSRSWPARKSRPARRSR